MDYRSFQAGPDAKILTMLLTLHGPGNPQILDTTSNVGVMWQGTAYRPLRLDRNSAVSPHVVADFGALPFAGNSWDVLVFDPPHLPQAGGSAYSTTPYRTAYGITNDPARAGDHVGGLFAPFVQEAARVLRPGGIVLAKIADLVHNHTYQWQHILFIQAAQAAGLTACDCVIKGYLAGNRVTSGKWKQQYHVRNSHCYWIVLRKGGCEGTGLARPSHPNQTAFGFD